MSHHARVLWSAVGIAAVVAGIIVALVLDVLLLGQP